MTKTDLEEGGSIVVISEPTAHKMLELQVKQSLTDALMSAAEAELASRAKSDFPGHDEPRSARPSWASSGCRRWR